MIAKLQKNGYDLKKYKEKVFEIESVISNLLKNTRDRQRGTVRSRKRRKVVSDSELQNDKEEDPLKSNAAGFIDEIFQVENEGESERNSIGGSLS